jgi:hypothetical protein
MALLYYIFNLHHYMDIMLSEHCYRPESRIIVKKSIVLSHNSQSEPLELWDKKNKSGHSYPTFN